MSGTKTLGARIVVHHKKSNKNEDGMSKTVMLTGANGFVGAGVLSHLLDNTDWTFILPTTSLHHGSQTRLNNTLRRYNSKQMMGKNPVLSDERVLIVRCDLTQPFTHRIFGDAPTPELILNIASESHVDRSIEDPTTFVRNNVELILNVLEYAREVKPKLVLHMSTDEVFGNAREGEYHREWDAIRPSNPYSASKAAQEAIAYSYWRTYGVPLVITNTMNLIAPVRVSPQGSEKFVPMVIKRLLNDEEVTIHVDENGESGSRCWIDVRDFAEAWEFLIGHYLDNPLEATYYPHQRHTPAKYNIVGVERSNRWVAERLAELLGIENPKLVDVDFHSSRPGHDPRYALDGDKLFSLGWEGPRPLEVTLADIIVDYQNHPEFLEE